MLLLLLLLEMIGEMTWPFMVSVVVIVTTSLTINVGVGIVTVVVVAVFLIGLVVGV